MGRSEGGSIKEKEKREEKGIEGQEEAGFCSASACSSTPLPRMRGRPRGPALGSSLDQGSH